MKVWKILVSIQPKKTPTSSWFKNFFIKKRFCLFFKWHVSIKQEFFFVIPICAMIWSMETQLMCKKVIHCSFKTFKRTDVTEFWGFFKFCHWNHIDNQRTRVTCFMLASPSSFYEMQRASSHTVCLCLFCALVHSMNNVQWMKRQLDSSSQATYSTFSLISLTNFCFSKISNQVIPNYPISLDIHSAY